MPLVNLCSLIEFHFHVSLVRTGHLVVFSVFEGFENVLAVELAKSLARRTHSTRLVHHVVVGLRLDWLSFANQLVLLKMLNRGENVHVEVSAVEGGLAPSILAPRHVKSELAVVVELVVGVVRTDEDFDVAHLKVFEF